MKLNRLNYIGSSETPRAVCSEEISNTNTQTRRAHREPKFFSHWLSGIIDGDGSLLVSRAGYTSCEITVGEKEERILWVIKKKLGGSIKKRSKVRAFRWRLHNKPGMRTLVSFINGKLLLSQRQEQLKRVCAALGEEYRAGEGFSIHNSWLAGFYESEGYFHVNSTTLQLSITLTQKNLALLEEISKSLPGPIYYDKAWEGWLYAASSLEDISRWVLYFSRFPLLSWKQIQLRRFKRLILYKGRRVHLLEEGRPWKRFQRLLKEFNKEASAAAPKVIISEELSRKI